MSISILIGGDVCPVGRNTDLFRGSDPEPILGRLQSEFARADLVVVNLECPLIERPTPISKSGPAIGAPVACSNGITAMGVDVVGLANNHLMDHGTAGYESTISTLRDTRIQYVGAGRDAREAGRTLQIDIGGYRVGLVAVAEHEFSIAGPTTPGANGLSPIEFVREMRRIRSALDYVVVLYHGGAEWYPYPSPAQQNICRFMIEEGASAVVCQHSHCVGCTEEYGGGQIVYGQGNLIFDHGPSAPDIWTHGALVRLTLGNGATPELTLIPYVQSAAEPGADAMDSDAAEAFLEVVAERSRRVRQEGFVEREWDRFCRSKRYVYFSTLRGHSRPIRGVNRLTGFADRLYSRSDLLRLQNAIRCETHHEIIKRILSHID